MDCTRFESFDDSVYLPHNEAVLFVTQHSFHSSVLRFLLVLHSTSTLFCSINQLFGDVSMLKTNFTHV